MNWPDNLSKMAVVDPQDLHLHGVRLRLTDNYLYITCNTSYRTKCCVINYSYSCLIFDDSTSNEIVKFQSRYFRQDESGTHE